MSYLNCLKVTAKMILKGLQFPICLPVNIEWKAERFEFNLPMGPTINLPDSDKAINLFSLYFKDNLIEEMVRCTNRSAAVKRARK